MLLIFERLGEHSQFDIDRKNKRLKYTGEKTNFVEQELPWKMLWDKCDKHKSKPDQDNSKCLDCERVETKQDKETSILSNKDFTLIFQNQMNIYGFSLIKCNY